MEITLHAADLRWGKARRADGRAGLPVKRFFTRFGSLADVPAEDLDLLSERIRLALDASGGTDMAALHTAVRAELQHRGTAPRETAMND